MAKTFFYYTSSNPLTSTHYVTDGGVMLSCSVAIKSLTLQANAATEPESGGILSNIKDTVGSFFGSGSDQDAEVSASPPFSSVGVELLMGVDSSGNEVWTKYNRTIDLSREPYLQVTPPYPYYVFIKELSGFLGIRVDMSTISSGSLYMSITEFYNSTQTIW